MKKIIVSVLMTILVVVAGVGGYFTYKYFDLKKDQSSESSVMTIAEAKQLINKVSSDMGFLKVSTASKTLSVSYGDYSGEEVDFNGKKDFIKAFVLAAKFAFEGDIQEKTYYSSEASYSMFGTTYNGSMKLYFTLAKNVLELHLYDSNAKGEVIIKLDNSQNDENEWTMYMYANLTFAAGEGALNAKISADTNKINDFAYSELTFTSIPATMEEFTAANVNTFKIYDCDKRVNKLLNVSESDMTQNEIRDYAKTTVEEVNKQVSANFSELRSYTNINFLKSMYEYLGYNVI